MVGTPRAAAPWRSLRARVGLAFLLLAALVFGSIGALAGWQLRRDSEAAAAFTLQQLADRLAQRLDADLAERYREVALLATLEALTDVELDPARWRRMLEGMQARMPAYSWFGLADTDGTVLAATQGLLEGRSVQQRPWFQRGLGGPVLVEPHPAALLQQLIGAGAGAEPLRFVDVAAPLQRDGATVGVIGLHLSIAWAEARRREALASLGGIGDIEILLIGRDGSVVLGPAAPQPLPDGAAATVAGEGTGIADRSVSASRWSDGRRYLDARSPSRASGDFPGMPWTVRVRQPEAAAYAAARTLERRLWASGALAAALFGVGGWWLAGRLTRPLQRVAEHARAGAAGHAPAALAATDDVDQLAQSVSALIDGLRSREQALVTLAGELELRVEDRTAALQEANDALRSFSRSLSHDVRGPLGAMAMVLRQTTEQQAALLPPAAQQAYRAVADECARLRVLTEELLTLAMVEDRALQPGRVDMDGLVQAVLDELAPARPSGAEVVVAPLPPATGDAVLLRQVWLNLVANAYKFSSRVDRPRIEIGAEQRPGEVEYHVRDNGAGFDPTQQSRLFAAFERLHPPSAFPGTGVGLSIVRRVVQRHAGRVSASGAPGAGACFRFALPSPEAAAPPGPSAAPAAPAADLVLSPLPSGGSD